ncbi:YSIRK-type signal peptide-containing protein [Limosilactobacillus reuteri]|uniref:YSIRK-type signal peptide-containing protein n=1 Tax=Limosilactobacillus reuteri TaxID=1598 RepID=UPI001E3224EE|nr:PT domain-containing protein [Limosilactobacillus reuteri]MCC4327202.1 PT domain-containing protein [Limosilactobacillus reuteri]MCC4336223.1 PT domain-containing protein [Limosilactobacillus reuteri]
MSKNNAQEYIRKMEPQRQRFGLRKLSVGVASVLLGTTFMVGGSTVAHADVNTSSLVDDSSANVINLNSIASGSTVTLKTANSNSDGDTVNSNSAAKSVNTVNSTTSEESQNVSQNDSQSKSALGSQTSGSQQSVITNQLKESKVVTPAKQVSAILNIYDYDDVDPQTPKAQNGNDVAFTYTGKFTDGLSIKDAIQAQIDADTQKQLAYKDQGTAIVPDKDGNPTEIGVSPVVSAPFSDNDLGGYYFRDKTTDTYQHDQQTQLVDAYNKWMDYKKAHFALAGYKLVDQDEQAINLDDPIEDGKTYNIYVNHQLSIVNVYHWTELKRTVEFKYYYKQNDKNDQAADSVTKNGYYNDGKFNQEQPKQFINATGEPVFSNLPKKDSNHLNQTDISDVNSFETRLLPDDLKTTKDQTKVLHDTINSRYIDLAVGLITDNQGNLTNYGKANLVYPSGTVLFEGEPVKQIDGWHTFDPNVPDTGSDDILDINTYSTVQGVFNKGVGNAVEHVNNPATTTIYYYHDQPVDITFEDVTNGDANAPVLSNFTASKDLRVDLNSEYIPGKPHTTPKDKKNNKNPKYEAYSYQADDNTYDASAINVDPSGTLKSSKSLNYADVLKAYTDNGYVLVSSDPDDLTYEVEDVYDNNRNLQHKKRVVKLVHRAIAHTDTKTATRTIHYVANTKDGKQLQDDTTQNVTLTSSTYYTDAVTGNRVNAKQDTNGDWIVDTENAAALPAITWTVNADKSTGLTTDDKNFAAITTPETITLDEGEATKRGTDEGDWYLVSTDKNGEVSYGDPNSDTWNADTPNKIADGYLVYKQKAQYNIHYIDVNGVEGKTTYEPTDGKELKDHQVTGVGSEDKTYVGDTPDATQKLWSPADYEKAGYVLVGLSDNAKGDLLGKQTLTKGVQDQYVYLKHAVKTITPNTPVEDVPKDPDGKRAVDPSDLHKEFTRNITFVANNDAKNPLKDAVSQKVEFDGHIYVDMVTGQTTTPETVKDANGKTTQVATTKAGNIEWNHDTQTMDEVVQKYITLNKGDKYATSDDMVGTWHWISGVANEITLKPTSDNPVDLELVYEKNKGESGPDFNHDLPKLDYGQSGPELNYDLPKLDYGQSGPELDHDLPKLDYGQSGPELNYNLPKLDYGQSGPELDHDLPKLDYGQSGPELDHDLPKLDYGQSGPSTEYDLPKLDYGQSGPSTEYDLPKLDYGESGPSTDYDLPKLDYGQSGPSTDYDLPKLDYGQSGPELNYDLPKAEIPSQPTEQPTSQPTAQPTEQPTSQPTAQPTEQPTSQPTVQPTEQPTSQPTVQPTEQPTSQPTAQPTEQPTSQPTVQPTSQPTAQPTEQPTSQPTAQPTEQPTSQPTAQPTEQPTSQPTVQPTEQPTSQPTAQPSEQPSEQPAIESNTQLPGEQKDEEPQPMTTQVTAKKGETSIVEPTSSSSTQPAAKQEAQQLPQTGNQKSSSLIGLGFASLLSALGLTKVNKKRKD